MFVIRCMFLLFFLDGVVVIWDVLYGDNWFFVIL